MLVYSELSACQFVRIFHSSELNMSCFQIGFIFALLTVIAYGNEDFKKEDGIKAIIAKHVAMPHEGEDAVERAPACAVRCPNGIHCCNWSAPLCRGYGYCCPRQKPRFWNGYCY